MKIKYPRHIPAGSVAIRCTIVEAVAYVYEKTVGDKVYYVAIAYGGKRSKSDWHYRFMTAAERNAKVKEWMQGLIQSAHIRKAYRAEQNKPHTLKVGQVLRSMWGYDQTNIDYYEVTKVIGAHMVEIREIGCKLVGSGGGPSERVVPHVGNYLGEPMRKRASKDNSVRITSYAYASPYSGEAGHRTGSGWGH